MADFTKKIEEMDKGLGSKLSNIERDEWWKVFSKRFVAFLDIAGFKSTSKFEFYSYSLLQAFKEITKEEQKFYRENTNEYLYIIAISDSIIVFSKDDSINSFCCFSHAIGRIYNKCIILGRVVNAAVAYGEMFVDKDKLVFGGVPYDTAYNLQEQMGYYGILCDSSLNDYFIHNKDCTDENYLLYKSHYIDVDYYMKVKDTKEETVKIFKRFNYFWYDYELYGNVIYTTKIHWGMRHINVCTDDPNGLVVGSYTDHISNVIENYGEEKDKIKKRLNNTMNVLESMLKQQKVNYNQKFKRYDIDETTN